MTTPGVGVSALPLRHGELDGLVRAAGGDDGSVVTVRRSRYATSFPLFEVVVTRPGGSVELLVKDLRWSSLPAAARAAKQREAHDPARELRMYRQVLRHVDGPPRFVAGRGDRRSGTAWLAVEKVRGAELYQWGELEAWGLAAEWLGGFHARWRARPPAVRASGRRPPVLRHDAAHFASLADRVGARRGPDGDPRLQDVLAAWAAASDHLLTQPVTLSHGECYASNVLVTDDARVAVVDWETAATASGWSDLAALVVGWPAPEREAMLERYLRSAGSTSEDPRRELDAARLQLCVQWIGADPRWLPPAGQRRDWLGDAVELLEQAPWGW